jgi:hypothetical protein
MCKELAEVVCPRLTAQGIESALLVAAMSCLALRWPDGLLSNSLLAAGFLLPSGCNNGTHQSETQMFLLLRTTLVI